MIMNRTLAAGLLVAALTACHTEDPGLQETDPSDGRAALAATDMGPAASPTEEGRSAAPTDPASEARLRAALEERLTATDSAVQELPGLIASIRRDMRRNLNDAHVSAARGNGVGPVRDSAHVAALIESGALVQLPDSTRWWVLRELDRSFAYVTPGTRAVMEEIGRRFHARLDEHGLPPFRLDVTSVLRTDEQQAALRRRNANAAGTTSSHQFGTTLDVAYLSFAAPQSLDHESLTPDSLRTLPRSLRREVTERLDTLAVRHAPHLEGELGAVLQELQRDGVALPLRERSQPVFHITVARDPA